MEPTILSIIIGGASLLVGALLGKMIFAKDTKKNVEEARSEAKKILSEAQFQA